MESETRKVFKIIFAWQDDREEKWLEQQAAAGWHLQEVAPFVYTFRRGELARVIYRLDYKLTIDKDYQEYREIFQSCGWELVTTMANWHYYRVSADNEAVPEIYSNNHSRAQKYRRLLTVIIPAFVIFFVVLSPTKNRSLFTAGSGWLGTVYGIAGILQTIILLFFVYAIVKIVLKIRKLESGPRE